MRYAFVALLGLLLGAAAAGAVLYYNPLTAEAGAGPDPADRSFRYALPGEVLGFTRGEHLLPPDPALPEGELWEETIDRTAVLGIVLKDEQDRPVAIASRLMAASAATDLLLRGVVVSDDWLLTIPGEGTVYVRTDANVWPLLKSTLLPVWYLNRPWQGPVEYRPTAGPGPDGAGVVIGATGRFAGLTGRAVEQFRLTELDPASASAAALGELDWHLAEPQVASGE